MAPTSGNVFNTNPTAMRIVAANEKVTGPPAVEMLRRSGIADTPTEQLEAMDNACGSGIVTTELLKMHQKPQAQPKFKRVVASDIDDSMLEYLRRRAKDSDWQNIEVFQADQQSVPLPDEIFTHIFNNFGVFFSPNDEKVLSETLRLLKPDGLAGFTTWKKLAWWDGLVMPAIAAHIPAAPPLAHPSTIFPSRGWSEPKVISDKLERAGFRDVQVSEHNFTPDVGPEEFAESCAALVKAATKRLWSEEHHQEYSERIEPAIRQYLFDNFPEGRWNGKMLAIISLGRKL